MQSLEDFTTSQHVSVISEQMMATQQQVQQLQELFTEAAKTNRLLVHEVLILQKIVNAHNGAQNEILNHLAVYPGGTNTIINRPVATQGSAPLLGRQQSALGLRRARELLASVAPDALVNRELERLDDLHGSLTDFSVMDSVVTMPVLHDCLTDPIRYPVYPAGETVGIDPFASDHIQNLPYAMPSNSTAANELAQCHQFAPQHKPASTSPNPVIGARTVFPMQETRTTWGTKKPRVFLVEDDPTCARIGIQFLKSMGCESEHAVGSVSLFLFTSFLTSANSTRLMVLKRVRE